MALGYFLFGWADNFPVSCRRLKRAQPEEDHSHKFVLVIKVSSYLFSVCERDILRILTRDVNWF